MVNIDSKFVSNTDCILPWIYDMLLLEGLLTLNLYENHDLFFLQMIPPFVLFYQTTNDS